jgi:hypothetical protein
MHLRENALLGQEGIELASVMASVSQARGNRSKSSQKILCKIGNDNNGNHTRSWKEVVNFARLSQFQQFSNINFFECHPQKVTNMQANLILLSCKFIGHLNELQGSRLVANISDQLFRSASVHAYCGWSRNLTAARQPFPGNTFVQTWSIIFSGQT